MARLVNKRELAELLGISERALTDWQSDGMPIARRGERGEENAYDLSAIMDWRVDKALARHGDTEAELRRRMLKLDLEEKEAAAALRRGELVPASEVRPLWDSRVLAAATYMIGRASRLAGEIEAAGGLEAKRAVLRKADAEFLTRLGVHGERMQDLLERFLERCPREEVQMLLSAIGDDGEPT